MNERIEKSIKFGEFMDPNHYAWNTYSKTRKNSHKSGQEGPVPSGR